MTILPYNSTHRNGCIAIFHSNCPPFFDPLELNGLEKWLDARDANRIAYETNAAEYYYVLEHDQQVIAAGGFYISGNNPVAKLTWGMVHRSFHKQGFGKQLVQYRIGQMKQLFPQHTILLDTSQHTYPFYEKMGFTITKTTKDGYGPGLDRYDMSKKQL